MSTESGTDNIIMNNDVVKIDETIKKPNITVPDEANQTLIEINSTLAEIREIFSDTKRIQEEVLQQQSESARAISNVTQLLNKTERLHKELCELKDKESKSLQILKLDRDARIPKRQTSGSAGYDLYSLADGLVGPHTHTLVPTGIAIKLPPGTYGRIAPRSGLAVRNGIDVFAGVIDYDYFPLGVGIILYNSTNETFTFDKHTRIAQLIVTPILTPDVEEIYSADVDETNERTGGFGSTGV